MSQQIGIAKHLAAENTQLMFEVSEEMDRLLPDVARDTVSRLLPRWLWPLSLKTIASSKILSSARSRSATQFSFVNFSIMASIGSLIGALCGILFMR